MLTDNLIFENSIFGRTKGVLHGIFSGIEIKFITKIGVGILYPHIPIGIFVNSKRIPSRKWYNAKSYIPENKTNLFFLQRDEHLFVRQERIPPSGYIYPLGFKCKPIKYLFIQLKSFSSKEVRFILHTNLGKFIGIKTYYKPPKGLFTYSTDFLSSSIEESDAVV